MSLYQSVCKFIEKEKLFLPGDFLLCAVSGGIDSMAMLDVLRTMDFKIHVAHVNYMLRGAESDMDQALVASYCAKYDIPHSCRQITSQELSDLKKSNFHEKARKLRYSWFHGLMDQLNADYLCVAHHRQDVVETFILHALRGSGMAGLKSIPLKSNGIRRPLIKSGKEEITAYVNQHKVPYRDDHSNKTDEYDRNYVRNKVIPTLTNRWAHSKEGIAESAQNISKDFKLLQDLIEPVRRKWIKPGSGIFKLGPISQFRKIPSASNLGYHLLKDYGFHSDTIQKMLFEEHTPGKIFKSPTHEAVTDRDYLLWQVKSEITKIEKSIREPGQIDTLYGRLSVTKIQKRKSVRDLLIQYIDPSSVIWPLVLRTWKEGDIIEPLGMGGQHKKISDILIDHKASLFEKRKQLVLCNGDGTIIWLPGKKLSDEFKYDSKTTEFLELEWIDSA